MKDAKKHTNMPAAETAKGNMRAFQPAERMSAEVAAITCEVVVEWRER
jgi:hypothetical protein